MPLLRFSDNKTSSTYFHVPKLGDVALPKSLTVVSLSHMGFVILGIGIIQDSFHEIGKTPDDKETLKIVAARVANSKANSLNILLGIFVLMQ